MRHDNSLLIARALAATDAELDKWSMGRVNRLLDALKRPETLRADVEPIRLEARVLASLNRVSSAYRPSTDPFAGW